MNDCTNCNGFGYLRVMNGDDDIACEVCGGTGDAPTSAPETGNTVAVEEKLSPESELRLQLATYDETMDSDGSSVDFVALGRHDAAGRWLLMHLEDNLHMLLSLLDAERKETQRLNRELQARDALIKQANNDGYSEGYADAKADFKSWD